MNLSAAWLRKSLALALFAAACSGTSPSGSGGSTSSGAGAGAGPSADPAGHGGESSLAAGAGPGVNGGSGGARTGGSSVGGASVGGGSVGGGSSGGGSSGGGSSGQVNASVGFMAERVTVTGVRGTATPPASAVIQLHNASARAVQLENLSLGGADSALFQLEEPPSLPASLAANADLSVRVALTTTGSSLPAAPSNKDTGSVLLTASLTATLASGSVTASVFGLLLTQDNYEPTLGQILTTLGDSLDVGKAQNDWNPNQSMSATNLPGIEPSSDEVAASHFVKAGTGDVGLSLVARFSPPGALPYGWYSTTTGCPAGCTTVGTMAQISDGQTSDKARMVNPPPGAGSMSTFDPGSGPFGLWVYSDQKTQQFQEGGSAINGDWDYSEDALNAPANVHRFKSYPLKDAAGGSVPHTYLVAVEEAGNGDYQDYVFVLSNVTAQP